jgi:hypothetical protein
MRRWYTIIFEWDLKPGRFDRGHVERVKSKSKKLAINAAWKKFKRHYINYNWFNKRNNLIIRGKSPNTRTW